MTVSTSEKLKAIYEKVKKKDPHQEEFLQAVDEVLMSLGPILEKEPKYWDVVERICEPERAIQFRVPWLDSNGKVQVNRGFRVQFNSAIGPYKGGLRFHPSVNLSIMKFLGFEQTFKNALTTLPMGGAKGGSDFDPKGKSDTEIMAFCQSFMNELNKYIGPETDVPAGDIGVSSREIGFLFGQYKKIRGRFDGTLTGKGFTFGGSLLRPEATGFGIVYFFHELLKDHGKKMKGLKVIVSGSGNVAQYTAKKLIDLGAVVLTMSDSSGYIYEEKGITKEGLEEILKIKNERRGRIEEYTKFSKSAKFHKNEKPWKEKAEGAIPCATQNEIEKEDAEKLVKNGIKYLIEGANMPCSSAAISYFLHHKVLFAPSKACNAGGVAVSGLEMSQNAQHLQWTETEVDEKLHDIMSKIYHTIKKTAQEIGQPSNLQKGANIAGFVKVADAMLSQGCV